MKKTTTKKTAVNPFPGFPRTLPDGRIIIDEMCQCGELRSLHGTAVMTPGHGACLKSGCRQFSWKDFVFKKAARQ